MYGPACHDASRVQMMSVYPFLWLAVPHIIPRTSRSSSSPVSTLFASLDASSGDSGTEEPSSHSESIFEAPSEVILLPLDPYAAACDPKLLLSEAKVLEAAGGARKSNRVSIQPPAGGAPEQPSGSEKRTRFSLSHDQESVGEAAVLSALLCAAPPACVVLLSFHVASLSLFSLQMGSRNSRVSPTTALCTVRLSQPFAFRFTTTPLLFLLLFSLLRFHLPPTGFFACACSRPDVER